MPFDLQTAIPVNDTSFDLDTARPVDPNEPPRTPSMLGEFVNLTRKFNAYAQDAVSIPQRLMMEPLKRPVAKFIEYGGKIARGIGTTVQENQDHPMRRAYEAPGAETLYEMKPETLKAFHAGFAYPDIPTDYPVGKITTVGKLIREHGENIFKLYEDTPEGLNEFNNNKWLPKQLKILGTTAGRTAFDFIAMLGDIYTDPAQYLLMKGLNKGVLMVAEDIPLLKMDILRRGQAEFRFPETVTLRTKPGIEFDRSIKVVISPKEYNDLESLVGNKAMWAFRNGDPIDLPTRVIATVTDRPYWAAIKNIFGKPESLPKSMTVMQQMPTRANVETPRLMLPKKAGAIIPGDLIKDAAGQLGRVIEVLSDQEAIVMIAGKQVLSIASTIESIPKSIEDMDTPKVINKNKETYTAEELQKGFKVWLSTPAGKSRWAAAQGATGDALRFEMFNRLLASGADSAIRAMGKIGPNQRLVKLSDIQFVRRPQPDTGFFSKAASVIAEKMPNNASVSQVEGVLMSGGVSPDEIDAINLTDYLKGKDVVNKEDLLKYVEENQPDIEIVRKGGKLSAEDIPEAIELKEKYNIYTETNQDDRRMIAFVDGSDHESELMSSQDMRSLGRGPEEQEYWDKIADLAEAVERNYEKNYEQYDKAVRFPTYVEPGGKDYEEILMRRKAKIIKEVKPQTIGGRRYDYDEMDINFSGTIDVGSRTKVTGDGLKLDWEGLSRRIPHGTFNILKHLEATKGITWNDGYIMPYKSIGGPRPGSLTQKVIINGLDRGGNVYQFYRNPGNLTGPGSTVFYMNKRRIDLVQFLGRGVTIPNYSQPRQDIRIGQRTVERTEKPGFTGGHWGISDVFGHTRINKRSVDSPDDTTFIEEVQSDWMNEGRKIGFKTGEGGLNKIQAKRLQELEDKEQDGKMTDSEADQLDGLRDLRSKAEERGQSGVPYSPLVKQYVTLLLKQLLMDAARQGKKYIAWTTGDQQIERWKSALRQAVDKITWEKTDKGYSFKAVKRAWAEARTTAFRSESVIAEKKDLTHQELADTLGKAIADDIKNSPETSGKIEGEGLRIDAEWPHNLYDKQIPNILKDLIKTEVKTVDVGGLNGMAINRIDYKVIKSTGMIEINGVKDQTVVYTRKLNSQEMYKFLGPKIADRIIADKADKLWAPGHGIIYNVEGQTLQPGIELTPEIRRKILSEGFPMFGKTPALIGKPGAAPAKMQVFKMDESVQVVNTKGNKVTLPKGEVYRTMPVYDSKGNVVPNKIELIDGKEVTVFTGELAKLKGKLVTNPGDVPAGGMTPEMRRKNRKKEMEGWKDIPEVADRLTMMEKDFFDKYVVEGKTLAQISKETGEDIKSLERMEKMVHSRMNELYDEHGAAQEEEIASSQGEIMSEWKKKTKDYLAGRLDRDLMNEGEYVELKKLPWLWANEGEAGIRPDVVASEMIELGFPLEEATEAEVISFIKDVFDQEIQGRAIAEAANYDKKKTKELQKAVRDASFKSQKASQKAPERQITGVGNGSVISVREDINGEERARIFKNMPFSLLGNKAEVLSRLTSKFKKAIVAGIEKVYDLWGGAKGYRVGLFQNLPAKDYALNELSDERYNYYKNVQNPESQKIMKATLEAITAEFSALMQDAFGLPQAKNNKDFLDMLNTWLKMGMRAERYGFASLEIQDFGDRLLAEAEADRFASPESSAKYYFLQNTGIRGVSSGEKGYDWNQGLISKADQKMKVDVLTKIADRVARLDAELKRDADLPLTQKDAWDAMDELTKELTVQPTEGKVLTFRDKGFEIKKEEAINEIKPLLKEGFSVQLEGGVSNIGVSKHDLDISFESSSIDETMRFKDTLRAQGWKLNDKFEADDENPYMENWGKIINNKKVGLDISYGDIGDFEHDIEAQKNLLSTPTEGKVGTDPKKTVVLVDPQYLNPSEEAGTYSVGSGDNTWEGHKANLEAHLLPLIKTGVKIIYTNNADPELVKWLQKNKLPYNIEEAVGKAGKQEGRDELISFINFEDVLSAGFSAERPVGSVQPGGEGDTEPGRQYVTPRVTGESRKFTAFLEELKAKAQAEAEKQALLGRIEEMVKGKFLSKITVSRIRKYLGIREIKNTGIAEVQKLFDYIETLQTGDKLLSEKQIATIKKMAGDIQGLEIMPKRIAIGMLGSNEEVLLQGRIVGRLPLELLPTVDIKEGSPAVAKLIDGIESKTEDAEHETNRRDEAFEKMITAAEKSRAPKLSTGERTKRLLIKTNPEIFKALSGEKVDLTKEEVAVVAYLKNFFNMVKEDLALKKYRKNYVTHMEQPLMEKILERGVIGAIRQYLDEQKAKKGIDTDILLELDNIIGSEKFFRYALQRKGGIDPTTNLRKILHDYGTLFEAKKALDAVLPDGQLVAKLLLQGRDALWMKKFMQNLKGRGMDNEFRNGRMGWLADLGDKVIDGLYIKVLALNKWSPVKNLVAGEANALIWQSVSQYLKGKARMTDHPKKAYDMAVRYGILDGTYADYSQRGIGRLKNIQDWMMIGQKGGEVLIRTAMMLAELTDEEWATGKLSREAEVRIRDVVAITQGVFSRTQSPIWVQTGFGRAVMMLNRWRITDFMLARRIINDAYKEYKKGNYEGIHTDRLVKMLLFYAVGMYLQFELAKRGFKKAAQVAQSMAEVVNSTISLFTQGDLAQMATDNPVFSTLKELSHTLQEITNYIHVPGATPPRDIEFTEGIEDTYIAPAQTIHDLIESLR